MELTTEQGYLDLLQQISDPYTEGRIQAVQAVNIHITQAYYLPEREELRRELELTLREAGEANLPPDA